MIKGFKEFISRGNVIDLAVGVIIGGAFGKIVSSLVNDVIMPFIGIVSGGLDLKDMSYTLGNATIAYGELYTKYHRLFHYCRLYFCHSQNHE